MAKLPDISEITKKLDLQGLLDNVKTAISNVTSGSGSTTQPPLQSELISKCQNLQEMMHSTLKTQAELNDQINQLKHKLGELARDIQSFEVARHATVAETPAKASTVTTPNTSKPSSHENKSTK